MLLSVVSAGIYFSQISGPYNLGDIVSVDINIEPIKEGPFKLKLFCNGNSKEVFNGPPITNIKIPLNSYWIGDLRGDCYFSGEYYGESERSYPDFKISNELTISLVTESIFAKPGETINIKGFVKRLNGAGSEGEIEVDFPLLSLMSNNLTDQNLSSNTENGVFHEKVRNGEFSIDFPLPKNIAAGDYKINLKAYEKTSSGEKTNEGSAIINLKVSQVLTSIDISLNKNNFNPGESLIIKPVLLDQTGGIIHDQLSIIITDENLNRIFEKVVQSEETVEYKIPTNQHSGYYTIKISSGDLNLSKSFYLNEKAIASFELLNSTLIIKNIGNIRYKKDVQIELNGKPFVKKVDLDLGETKEFKLTGTEGSYDVRVSDGENELKQGGVLLTGSVIGVSEDKERTVIEKINPIIWIFLIIVLLSGSILFFVNVRKRKSVAYPIEKSEEKKYLKLDNLNKEKGVEEKGIKETKKLSLVLPKRLVSPTEAEAGMVLTGSKSRVAVLALKIKNKINKDLKIVLENSLDPIYEKKGCVYEHGDFVIAIFSPLVTKTFRNEIDAVKVAEKILISLKSHNDKFKDKIEFGIGINSGEILNEIRENKLIFTALGNSIIDAKKLADLASKEQILLTKEAHEKTISETKTEKKSFGEIEAFELKRVADSDKNKKFIEDFLKRNEPKAKLF